MDAVEVQLKILLDVLQKKENYLLACLDLTDKQNQMIKQVQYDIKEYTAILKEKQQLAEEIRAADDTFVSIYAKIKRYIDTGKENYKVLIGQMQEKVKTVTDLTVKVQVMEERIAKLGTQLVRRPRKVTTLKRDAINSYIKYGKSR